jgi:hypothetical protein
MSAHHRRHHTYVSLLFCRLEYWIIFGIFNLLEVALDLMFWSVVVHFYMKRLFCLTATLLCRPARLPMHISIDVVKLGFLVYCQLPFHGYGNGAHFLYLQVCDKKKCACAPALPTSVSCIACNTTCSMSGLGFSITGRTLNEHLPACLGPRLCSEVHWRPLPGPLLLAGRQGLLLQGRPRWPLSVHHSSSGLGR